MNDHSMASRTYSSCSSLNTCYRSQDITLYISRLGFYLTTDFLKSYTHTHTHLTALVSGTTQVSQYQKGKTNLDFTETRDSEWQWHQLGHMQVCTSLQRDNHTSTPPLCFLQAGCPFCRPTNSVKELKARVKALKAPASKHWGQELVD